MLDISSLRQEKTDMVSYGVQFKDMVEITTTNIAISPTTLITRIGGIIGVGKKLLWVIVFCCGYLTSLLSIFNDFCNCS